MEESWTQMYADSLKDMARFSFHQQICFVSLC